MCWFPHLWIGFLFLLTAFLAFSKARCVRVCGHSFLESDLSFFLFSYGFYAKFVPSRTSSLIPARSPSLALPHCLYLSAFSFHTHTVPFYRSQLGTIHLLRRFVCPTLISATITDVETIFRQVLQVGIRQLYGPKCASIQSCAYMIGNRFLILRFNVSGELVCIESKRFVTGCIITLPAWICVCVSVPGNRLLIRSTMQSLNPCLCACFI